MRFPNASKNISFVDLFFQKNSSHAGNFPLRLNFDIFLSSLRGWECHVRMSHQCKFSMANKNSKQLWWGKTLITTKETKTLAALVVLRLFDLTTWAAESFSRHKRFWTKIKLQIVILSRIWTSYLSRVS